MQAYFDNQNTPKTGYSSLSVFQTTRDLVMEQMTKKTDMPKPKNFSENMRHTLKTQARACFFNKEEKPVLYWKPVHTGHLTHQDSRPTKDLHTLIPKDAQSFIFTDVRDYNQKEFITCVFEILKDKAKIRVPKKKWLSVFTSNLNLKKLFHHSTKIKRALYPNNIAALASLNAWLSDHTNYIHENTSSMNSSNVTCKAQSIALHYILKRQLYTSANTNYMVSLNSTV